MLWQRHVSGIRIGHIKSQRTSELHVSCRVISHALCSISKACENTEKPSWGTGDRATCTSLQLSLLQVASLRHSGILSSLSKLHSALITAVHGSLGPSVPSIYPRQSPHEESSRSCSALPNPVIASPRLLTGDAGVEREGFMQLRNRPAMTQICPSSELLVNPDQGHSHSKTTIKKRTL